MIRQQVRRVERPDRQRQRDVDASAGIETREAGTSDAHDRDRSAVDAQAAPEDRRIPAELPLPVAVADHGNQRILSGAVVLGEEPATERDRDAEHGVIVAADELTAGRFDAVAGCHPERGARVAGRAGEQVGSSADALVVRIVRRRGGPLGAVRDENQFVRIVHRHRPQHDRFEQAEDRGVRADAERERQDDDRGEPGIAPERAQRVAHVLVDLFQSRPRPHRARRFFRQRDVAERDQRLPARFVRRHAAIDVVLHFALEVIADVRLEAVQRTLFARHRLIPEPRA